MSYGVPGGLAVAIARLEEEEAAPDVGYAGTGIVHGLLTKGGIVQEYDADSVMMLSAGIGGDLPSLKLRR